MDSIRQQSITGKGEAETGTKAWSPNAIVHDFLLQREPAFGRLVKLRDKVALHPKIIAVNEG